MNERDKATIKGFYVEAFVMESDLLTQVSEALGVSLPETDPHKRLLEEMAFRQGYGRDPGLGDAVLDAMRSALAVQEQRFDVLGGCV